MNSKNDKYEPHDTMVNNSVPTTPNEDPAETTGSSRIQKSLLLSPFV